jgi:hypothetical protein
MTGSSARTTVDGAMWRENPEEVKKKTVACHRAPCDVVNGRGALRLAWYASFVDLRDKRTSNGRFRRITRSWRFCEE